MQQRIFKSIAEGLPLLKEELAAIANTGSMRWISLVLTVLNTGCRSERKTRTLSTRSR